MEHAILCKQQVGHALHIGRSIDLKLGYQSGPLVPAAVNKPCIVEAVVGVQVGKENGVQVGGLVAGAQEILVRARAMIRPSWKER